MLTRILASHRVGAVLIALFCGLFLLGCPGNDEEPLPPEPARETAAGEPVPTEESSPATVPGRMTFLLDGERREFDFLPYRDNFYRSIVSSITAKPSADSTEQLRIHITNIDLREAETPGELPPAGAGLTLETAGQMVMFAYTDEAGEGWGTAGRIHVESFDDDTLSATFSDLTLAHSEREKPNITVTDGSVRAELD
jgi:hypothetical protein